MSLIKSIFLGLLYLTGGGATKAVSEPKSFGDSDTISSIFNPPHLQYANSTQPFSARAVASFSPYSDSGICPAICEANFTSTSLLGTHSEFFQGDKDLESSDGVDVSDKVLPATPIPSTETTTSSTETTTSAGTCPLSAATCSVLNPFEEPSETPTSSAETPISSVETPISSVETPTSSTETPTSSAATPTPSTETPTSSAATPTPSTETPTSSAATPTPSTETPTSSAATPTPSTETPATSIGKHLAAGLGIGALGTLAFVGGKAAKKKFFPSSSPVQPKKTTEVSFEKTGNGIVTINGKRYQMTVKQNGKDITSDVIKNPNNVHMRRVACRVCEFLAENQVLATTKKASVTLAENAGTAEISKVITDKGDITTQIQSKDTSALTEAYKSALGRQVMPYNPAAASAKPTTSPKISTQSLTTQSFNSGGNCLPVSLLHQRYQTQNTALPLNLDDFSNSATTDFRTPVHNFLNVEANRTEIIRRIKNKESNYHLLLANFFEQISEPDRNLFGNKSLFADRSATLANIRDKPNTIRDTEYDTMLQEYARFLTHRTSGTGHTYLDEFFLQLYVDVENSQRVQNRRPLLRIVIVQDNIQQRKVQGQKIQAILPNTLEDPIDFDNFYFIHHNQNHYTSVTRDRSAMQQLVQNYQNSILAGFFSRTKGRNGNNPIGSDGIDELIKEIRNLKNLYPQAYTAITNKLHQAQHPSSLTTTDAERDEAINALEVQLKASLSREGAVFASIILEEMGIEEETIARDLLRTGSTGTGSSGHPRPVSSSTQTSPQTVATLEEEEDDDEYEHLHSS